MLSEKIEILKSIREVLVQYSKSSVYNHQENNETRVWVANIYMACSLFELGFLTSRPISKEEEFYFSGSYFVSRFICDGEFEELSILYDQIVEQAKSANYFRTR